MLYNKDLGKVRASSDCITCKHFDKTQKKCTGIGVCCFEYDPSTSTIIDPVTQIPLKTGE